MKRELLSISFIVASFLCKATIINVPANYPTIQAAILATANGDTVLVAPGTYFENLNFRGHKIVLTSLYYLNKDTSFIKSTIINGSQPSNPDTASCVIINSGEDSTTVLQGFTLTGGAGTKWNDIHGAGIYREGGGIIIEFCSPIIQNNLIVFNTTSQGTGVSSAGGGGIRIGDGFPVIRNNVVAFNTGRYGAGIVLNYTGVLMENNLICYNSGAQDYGGAGIWASSSLTGHSKQIINNTIVNNHAIGNSGGGLIYSNTSILLKNNILWGNTASTIATSQISGATATLTATFNDVQTVLTGSGNINTNPLFADSLSFYLPSISTAVDVGDSSSQYNDVEDLLNPGNALFPAMNTLRNDIGVYGGSGASLLPKLYLTPPTGLEEQDVMEMFFQIFPNPSYETLNINYMLAQYSSVQLRLTDVTGKVLLKTINYSAYI